MSIKKYLKRGLIFILKGVPERKTTPQIVKLAENELLKGKTALITGGSSGIGLAIAKSFLNSGAYVIITGRNQAKLDECCSLLEKEPHYNGRTLGIVWDNADISAFQDKFNQVIKAINGRKIDILVNNAGVLGGELSTATEEVYDNILDTNLKGTFFLCQLIGRYMRDNQIEGNILNIASSSALRPAASAYTISKWGLRGMTLGFAKLMAPYGITVNAIAPGPTATPMLKRDLSDITFEKNPIGRFALPEEIANMAVFLVSGMGRTIVGDTIYMTGGAGLITFDDVAYKF